MLSIGKVTAASRNYHQLQVADGREDYYAGQGEAPGRWAGAVAHELELTGELTREGHQALVAARDPRTGEPLGERVGESKVLAYDLTFSAPKSVSVLFAVGDDELSGALVEAHEAAAAAALEHLEREACAVRRGHGGTERQDADGFLAAAYRHRMSRARDPQLHTHLVVCNAARGSDGRWSALDGQRLYRQAKAAGYLYEAQLRVEVRTRLPWVEWGPVRKGIAEIEGVPAGVLRHFSRRRQAIEEWLADNGRDGRRSAEKAALATREAKGGYVDTPGWRADVRAQAAEHGLGRAELEDLEGRAIREAPAALDAAALAERLSGPDGLTCHRNAFAQRDALCEWAAAHGQGASVQDVELATAGYLAGPDVVALGEEDLHTTEDLLACERQIVDGALRRDSDGAGRIDAAALERSLERRGRTLSDEQATAIAAVTASGRGIEAIEALAGTGKTYAAGALAGAYRDAGYRVVGSGPTGRSVRELKEQAGIPESFTLARLAGELTDYGGFETRRTLLVLDEAGMAPTRETAVVLAHAERSGVKVVAIGDSGQLASVQAGGWLAALNRRFSSERLTEVMRQRDPLERRRLAEVHDGEPGRYLLHKLGTAELSLHPQTAGAEARALTDWSAAQAARPWGQATLVARDNATRERLNAGAREWARASGRLGETMSAADREFAVGDRIITRRNDRFYDVDNGTRGTVRAVDPDARELVMESDAGGLHRLPADYLAAHAEHAYALTGHGTQGGTVEWAGVVGTPEDFSRNWSYTALSRGREPTRLYVAAELPAPARERAADRAEIAPEAPPEPGPALARLARAMRVPDDEPLALERLEAHEPPELPDRLPEAAAGSAPGSDELRAELRSLDARLGSYPDDLAAELERARAARTRAEGELALAQIRLKDPEAAGPASTPAIERLRAEQAQRDLAAARARERELAPQVPDRGQWEQEHAPLRERAAALREDLAGRRDRHLERTLDDPSVEIRDALGDRPPGGPRRAAWDRGARAVAGYRFDRAPTGEGPLGHRPGGQAERREWREATRELERAQRALGRERERHGRDRGRA